MRLLKRAISHPEWRNWRLTPRILSPNPSILASKSQVRYRSLFLVIVKNGREITDEADSRGLGEHSDRAGDAYTALFSLLTSLQLIDN